MPLYEYRCHGCGQIFELLRRIDDADRPTECPDCRSDNVERQFSTFATRGCGTPGSSGFT